MILVVHFHAIMILVVHFHVMLLSGHFHSFLLFGHLHLHTGHGLILFTLLGQCPGVHRASQLHLSLFTKMYHLVARIMFLGTCCGCGRGKQQNQTYHSRCTKVVIIKKHFFILQIELNFVIQYSADSDW